MSHRTFADCDDGRSQIDHDDDSDLSGAVGFGRLKET